MKVHPSHAGASTAYRLMHAMFEVAQGRSEDLYFCVITEGNARAASLQQRSAGHAPPGAALCTSCRAIENLPSILQGYHEWQQAASDRRRARIHAMTCPAVSDILQPWSLRFHFVLSLQNHTTGMDCSACDEAVEIDTRR